MIIILDALKNQKSTTKKEAKDLFDHTLCSISPPISPNNVLSIDNGFKSHGY